MKYRGLYGQSEGNESRQSNLDELNADNMICEGDYLKPMIAAAKKKDMVKLAEIRNNMVNDYVKQGVPRHKAQERADSCLRQAMIHMRI